MVSTEQIKRLLPEGFDCFLHWGFDRIFLWRMADRGTYVEAGLSPIESLSEDELKKFLEPMIARLNQQN